MIWIPAGDFLMGSTNYYPEERPVKKVQIEGFWMDPHPVTNKEFQKFVDATGYVTMAEQKPDPKAYPEIPADQLKAGSAVFMQPKQPVDLNSPLNWWTFRLGACWKNPQGHDSNLEGLENHPVVHIAFQDAMAYATWAEKQLPTEQEWEYAAKGGLEAADYAWGEELEPNGETMANIWKGTFPHENLKPQPAGITPVKTYPPNGYGLFDMCGNVWEWTTDDYSTSHVSEKALASEPPVSEKSGAPACCPTIPSPRLSRVRQRVIKGGSYLCSENYCSRYRPAARIPETEDTSTNHLGFRCIRRPV